MQLERMSGCAASAGTRVYERESSGVCSVKMGELWRLRRGAAPMRFPRMNGIYEIDFLAELKGEKTMTQRG